MIIQSSRVVDAAPSCVASSYVLRALVDQRESDT
jgi:hypothetical protein